MRIGPAMPGLLTLDAHPNNLPVQLTTFVGRRDDLSSIAELLSSSRLVTLTGPPGCGKTRLAAQTAADQIERWPNGAWWVELGAVTDAASVAGRVAAATGVLVEPRAGALRALTVPLRDRRLLVCLGQLRAGPRWRRRGSRDAAARLSSRVSPCDQPRAARRVRRSRVAGPADRCRRRACAIRRAGEPGATLAHARRRQ
jgi:hypothetical protein